MNTTKPEGLGRYLVSTTAIALAYIGVIVLITLAIQGCATAPALKPGDPPVYVPSGPVSYPRPR